MVYGTYNYSIHGVYKPSYNWGPHIVGFSRNIYEQTAGGHSTNICSRDCGDWISTMSDITKKIEQMYLIEI